MTHTALSSLFTSSQTVRERRTGRYDRHLLRSRACVSQSDQGDFRADGCLVAARAQAEAQ